VKRKKSIIILMILAIFILTLTGCNSSTSDILDKYGNIYGQVVDTNGNPVENAEVIINQDNKATTKSDGNFKIFDIKTDTYSIKASKYKITIDKEFFSNDVYKFNNIVKREVSISEGENTLDDLVLKPTIIIYNFDDYYNNNGYLNITGKIENKGKEYIDAVEITFKIFNSNEERIGSGFETINNLEVGEIVNWEISTSYDGPIENFDSYKIDIELY